MNEDVLVLTANSRHKRALFPIISSTHHVNDLDDNGEISHNDLKASRLQRRSAIKIVLLSTSQLLPPGCNNSISVRLSRVKRYVLLLSSATTQGHTWSAQWRLRDLRKGVQHRSSWPSCKFRSLGRWRVRISYRTRGQNSKKMCQTSMPNDRKMWWNRPIHTDSNRDNPIRNLTRKSSESIEEVVTPHMQGWVLFKWGYGWHSRRCQMSSVD